MTYSHYIVQHFSTTQQSFKESIVIPILQMRKLGLREICYVAHVLLAR